MDGIGIRIPVMLEIWIGNLRFKCWESLVTKICIVLKSEREFPVTKIITRDGRMVEPLEELSEWEESPIEHQHYFWVR